MGTNWLWNWRWTVIKTIKMMPIRPPMTNVKMTVRADCAVSACSPLPASIKALAHWLSVGGVGLWTGLCPLPRQAAGLWNKANFPSHQPGLFIGFRVASSPTPLPVTVSGSQPGAAVLSRHLAPGVFPSRAAMTTRRDGCEEPLLEARWPLEGALGRRS